MSKAPTTKISFHVAGTPVAQPRQRHRVISSKGRAFAQNYTPSNHPVTKYKAALKQAAWDEYSELPLEGPLRMDIVFVLPRPKNKVWKKKPMPRYPHSGKPDRDNLMKSTQDALEGILFRNDSQICAGEVEKYVASGDEKPHVEITIEAIQ